MISYKSNADCRWLCAHRIREADQALTRCDGLFLSAGLLVLRRILHSAKMKNRTIGRDEPAKNATCRKIATLTAQQPLDKHRRLWYNSLVHRQLLCVFQTAKQCEIRVLAAFSSAVFCRIFMRRLEGHGYGSATNRRPSGLVTDRLRLMLRRRRSGKAGITTKSRLDCCVLVSACLTETLRSPSIRLNDAPAGIQRLQRTSP